MLLCAGVVGGESGVQLTTMRRASDVFDRGCVAAHEGYLGLEPVQAHVQTSSSPAKNEVCNYTQDACVVSLMSTHASYPV